jgi:hypothetical protein
VSEELKLAIEAFSSLGDSGINAFIVWVVVGYLKTLTTATAWVIIFTFLIRRIGAALFNLAKAKNNG